MVLGILDVLEALGVIRLDASLQEGLKGLLVLIPLVELSGRKLGLLGSGGGLAHGLGRLAGAGLLLAGLLVLDIVLPLPAPRGGCGSRGGRRSWLSGGAVVVVYPPHVVPEVPLPGEAVAGDRPFTALICAQIGLLTMTVHGVRLTLMTQEAGSGREASILAALNLAAVGLEVGVDKFAE